MIRPFRMALLAALLVIATVASYAPVFRAGFVDVDDPDFVTENPVVARGFTAEGVAAAFRAAHAGNWFPLTWLSHMGDVALFGLEPGPHHAVNVALHVANALLLFAALALLTGAPLPSFAVAAIFALHPVQVESVAWISQRKTVLSTGFGFLALACWARWARAGARAAYAASLASFALSLLAKQTLVTLPFLLLVLDLWPLRRTARGWRALALEKLPFLALAAAASAVTLAVQGQAIATGETFPLAVRLGNAVLSYVRYFGLFFWPAKLAVFHPLDPAAVTPGAVVSAAGLLVASTVLLLAAARARPSLLAGWLWYLGTLVPVIGIVQVGAQAMADRYAYVPFVGLAILLVFGARDSLAALVPPAAARAVGAAALAAVCAALGVATWRQAGQWHDSVTLLESAVANTENNFVAHRALAAQYFNAGDYARALRHAEEGARSPRDPGEVLPLWGMALYVTGAKAEGLAKLEEATRVAPRTAIGWSNLGWAYLQEGDAARAREALAQGAAVDPESARMATLLAESELRLGRLDEAAASLARAVALEPTNFDARIELARTLARLGRFPESQAALASALDAARDFPEDRRAQLVSTLHQFRGDVSAAAGNPAAAVAAYEEALAAQPDNQGALLSLALRLAVGPGADPARAVELAERACTLSARRQPEALAALAASYAAAGRSEDASRTAREAIERARETRDAAEVSALEAQLRALAP
jgi:protein O-mannosyl-transferase